MSDEGFVQAPATERREGGRLKLGPESPGTGGQAYCSASDVARLNKARKLGEGLNPTVSDVATYCLFMAAEINAILLNKGYAVPIPSTYPAAYEFLRAVNAKAALVVMEEASPNSTILAKAGQAWKEAKEALVQAQWIMDAPLETPRTEPRGPGVTEPQLTFQPGEVYDPNAYPTGTPNEGPRAAPYLSRDQHF